MDESFNSDSFDEPYSLRIMAATSSERIQQPRVLGTRRNNLESLNDALRSHFDEQALLVYGSLLSIEVRMSKACSSNVVGCNDIDSQSGWVG